MNSFIQSVFAFIFAFGILVTFHELGHFLVARLCGVKVLRFSVGMGRILYSRRFGADQTEWAISLIPLGGYVKMLDAREQDIEGISPAEMKREFTSQNVWRRMAIVAAGPCANFLLAIVLFCGLYIHGTPEPTARLRVVPEHSVAFQAGLRGGELIVAVNGQSIRTWSDLRWQLVQLAIAKRDASLEFRAGQANTATATALLSLESVSPDDLESDFMSRLGLDLARPKAKLGKILPNGPAQQAGLHEDDLIISVNGARMADASDFTGATQTSAGKTLHISVERNGRALDFDVTPEPVFKDGKKIGQIKAMVYSGAPEMILADETPVRALTKAVQHTWDTSVLELRMIGKMITGEASLKNISGPITIADYAGQTARIGAISFINFIAFISISLGVMNLLPIPVLDGGLLLYYSLEVLTGRPVSERIGEIAQRAGLGILMALMIVALFNDIVRHFS